MSDDSLEAGLVRAGPFEVAAPAKRDFKPWHKPRKQYVRREQWLRAATSLLPTLAVGEPLRYLSLPGTDMLDVRYLGNRIAEEGRSLLFVGFNNDARADSSVAAQLNTTIVDLKASEHVDGRSTVIPDELATLAMMNSQGLASADRLGPFDVVNIDLCGGAMKEPTDGIGPSLYDALSCLFTIQRRSDRDWIFLLTTRVGDNHVDDNVLERLDELFRHNLADCSGFADICHGRIGGTSLDTEVDGVARFRLHSALIGKWLVATFARFNATATTEHVAHYTVHTPAGPDLLSLAVRVGPAGAIGDAAGLADPPVVDECQVAIEMVEAVCGSRDVDALLEADHQLRDAMTAESASLLVEANYDRNGYFEWLAGAG